VELREPLAEAGAGETLVPRPNWLEVAGGTRMPAQGAAYHLARGDDAR
jgi:hypothetical protein